MFLTLEQFGVVSTDASQQLDDRVVERGRDACLLMDLGAEARVHDAERELLLLGRAAAGQIALEEGLKGGRALVMGDSLHVLKRLFSGLEAVLGLEGDHLFESFKVIDCLLHFAELAASFVILLLLEEAVARGSLKQNKQRCHPLPILF